MARDVLERSIERSGWDILDETTIDAFLTSGGNCILFFAGDSSKRPEASDVAVILPELQKDFDHAFRVGVVLRDAFPALKDRFQVHFLPTLCLVRDGQVYGNVVRIQNWSDYHQKIQEFLSAPDKEVADV